MNNDSNSLLSLANDSTDVELLASGLKCVEYSAGYSKLYYASQENRYKDWLLVLTNKSKSIIFPPFVEFITMNEKELPGWIQYS